MLGFDLRIFATTTKQQGQQLRQTECGVGLLRIKQAELIRFLKVVVVVFHNCPGWFGTINGHCCNGWIADLLDSV